MPSPTAAEKNKARHSDPNGVSSSPPTSSGSGEAPKSLIEALITLQRPNSGAMGVHQVMVNALFTFPLHEVEMLLLQIVNVAVTYTAPEAEGGGEHVAQQLKKYLVFLASKSLYLGIRLCWLLESSQSQFEASEKAKSRVLGLKEHIKNAAVTHSLSISSFNQHDTNIMDRSNLFLNQLSFMNRLTKISGQLVQIPDKSARKAELRKLLDVINKEVLSEKVVGPDGFDSPAGVGASPTEGTSPRPVGGMDSDGRRRWRKQFLFPLASSTSSLQWVVRIVSSECVVFSSRERAPYLLWVETITDPGFVYADPLVPKDKVTSLTEEDLRGPLGPDGKAKGKGKKSFSSTTSTGGLNNNSSNLSQVMSINDYNQFRPPGAAPAEDGSIDALTMVFGESLGEKTARIREQSPYGEEEGWGLQALVIKAGDDLRQEEFALQLIDYFQAIWNDARVTSVTRPYSAIATDPSSGLLQFVTDSLSFDSVKKQAGVKTMNQFFVRAYGAEGSGTYAEAQRNFIESMAAYSVICYLLQIKDRHNGNLMLSRTGHLIHIDFGFLLATSPGGVNFESAPFKLSAELIEVLGGVNSPTFAYFRIVLFESFRTVRERADEILALIELVTPQTSLPCFGKDAAKEVQLLRQRMKLHLTDVQLAAEIKHMVDISCDNWRTKKYDEFQTWQNGII